MLKRNVKLVGLLLSVMLTAGCWDATNVNDLNIATMVIFDKKDDEYYIYLEIANITSSGKNQEQVGGPKSTIIKAHGKSITEAREQLDRQLDFPIFLATIRALIITERAARTDLEEYLYRLRADPSYRQKLLLVTTREEPEAITKSKPENNRLVGFSIDDTLQESIKDGQAEKRSTARYIQNLLVKSAFLIPCMGLHDEQVELKGYSVVSAKKCIGYIPVEESKPIVFISSNIPQWIYRVPLGDNVTSIRVEVNKKKIKSSYQEGNISFVLQFDFKATVMYFSMIEGEQKPLDKTTENALKDKLKNILEQDFQNTIELSQNGYKADYLGFDHEFRIKYPDEFKKLDWTEEFPKAAISFDFSIDMRAEASMDYEPD